MAQSEDVLIRITAEVDKSIKELKKLQQELKETADKTKKAGEDVDETGKKSASFGESMKKLERGLRSATIAVAAMGVAAKKAFDFALYGAQVQQLGESFSLMQQSIGGSTSLLYDMRNAVNGTVSDMELMRASNVALAGTSGQLATSLNNALPKLLEIAKASEKVNPALGDTGFLFESLTVGIKRLSPRLIDNTGLQIRLSQSYKELADERGKAVEDLTAEEQQLALLNATLAAGERLIEQAGNSTVSATDAFNKFSATAKNARDDFASLTKDALQPLVETLTILLFSDRLISDALDQQSSKVLETASSWEEYAEAMVAAIVVGQDLTDEQKKALLEFVILHGDVKEGVLAFAEAMEEADTAATDFNDNMDTLSGAMASATGATWGFNLSLGTGNDELIGAARNMADYVDTTNLASRDIAEAEIAQREFNERMAEFAPVAESADKALTKFAFSAEATYTMISNRISAIDERMEALDFAGFSRRFQKENEKVSDSFENMNEEIEGFQDQLKNILGEGADIGTGRDLVELFAQYETASNSFTSTFSSDQVKMRVEIAKLINAIADINTQDVIDDDDIGKMEEYNEKLSELTSEFSESLLPAQSEAQSEVFRLASAISELTGSKYLTGDQKEQIAQIIAGVDAAKEGHENAVEAHKRASQEITASYIKERTAALGAAAAAALATAQQTGRQEDYEIAKNMANAYKDAELYLRQFLTQTGLLSQFDLTRMEGIDRIFELFELVQGGADARRIINFKAELAVEKNQELLLNYVARDEPPTPRELLFTFEETGGEDILEVTDAVNGVPTNIGVNFNITTSGDTGIFQLAGGTSGSTRGNNEYRQAGGPVFPNRPYIVGEQGPELFMPNSTGRIVSNGTSNSMLQGGGAENITVYVSVGQVSNNIDIEQMAQQVAQKIQERSSTFRRRL